MAGAYGYDTSASAWRYALTYFRHDSIGGPERNVVARKSSPSPSFQFSDSAQINSTNPNPRTNAGLVYSYDALHPSVVNEFVAPYGF